LLVRRFKAPKQGFLGSSLPGRDSRLWGRTLDLAKPLDLGSQVGLGVEPGTGDLAVAGDAVEGDRGAVRFEFAEGLD
jgi:hypothetical protein